MCLILWLQRNFKPGCNYPCCRTHELGKINPTLFLSQLDSSRGGLLGCSGTFHSSEQGPGTPLSAATHSCIQETPLVGKPPEEFPVAQAGSEAVSGPCCGASIPVLLGETQGAGSGQQSLPGRRGRRSSFPKQGTATTLVEFLGQQVWKPIWSAGVFTRLENKPE